MCFIIYTYKEKFNIINDNNIQILKKSNTSTRKDIIDILHGNSNSNNKGHFDDINSKRDTIMTEINSKVKDINKLIDDKKIIFKDKYISNENNTNIMLSSIDNNHKYTIRTDPNSDSIKIQKIHGVTLGNIKLNTDNYALMLDYYSNKKLVNWKEHRKNLDHIFSDDALIYQILPNNIGVEVFTKDEFINKLTTPTKSLKQMKIISKSYASGQIVTLKFIIE